MKTYVAAGLQTGLIGSLMILGLLATPVAAQFGPPPPADPNAPTPRLANGHPI